MAIPKISIVIPVYHPGLYLHQALQSVKAQTYRDYEIIISDDTPDEAPTKKILNAFTGLPIRYLRNPQQKGIFNNLNNAIVNSVGSYIQIFCQDDIMKPQFLEEQLRTFESYPSAGLVFTGLDEIDEAGNVFESIPFYTEPPKSWSSFLPKAKAFNYLFAYGCIPRNLSPVMIRREVIDKVGLFNQSFPFAGDYEYWMRVAGQYDFATNQNALLQVRTHSNRASNTIGLMKLMPDVTVLLRQLYQKNTASSNKRAKYLQANNLLVGHFKTMLLNIAAGRFRYFTLLKYFQSPPFSIPTIIFLILHRYYKRRFILFIKEEHC